MRNFTRITITTAAVAGLAMVGALPATAADTTTTVEVQGGSLSITAPESLVLSAVVPGATATGSLSGVAVTDTTADMIGWSSSISISEFASVADPTKVIGMTNVEYVAGTAVVTGTATVTAATASEGSGDVQTATAVTGNNVATWDATLNVVVPGAALAATDYTATLTHSVL